MPSTNLGPAVQASTNYTAQLVASGSAATMNVASSGDTTGAKDTAAIQAALNVGGTIYLAAPLYTTNQTLTIYPNTELILNRNTVLQGVISNPVPLLQNYAFTAAQTVILSLTWSGFGPGITVVTQTPHGYVTGQWVSIINAAQPGFNGVFRVQSVGNSTTFSYASSLTPSSVNATVSSRYANMTTVAADVDIFVRGGTLIYAPTGSYPDQASSDCINFAHVYSGALEKIAFFNGSRSVWASQVRKFVIDQLHVENNPVAGNIMVSGPAHNCRASNISFFGSDDCFVYQAREWQSNSPRWLTEGDMIDCQVFNVTNFGSGKAVRLVNSGSYVMDGIVVDGIDGYSPDAAVTIEGDVPGTATGSYGRVDIRNCSAVAYNASVRAQYVSAEALKIDGVTVNTLASTFNGYNAVDIQNSTIQKLDIGSVHTLSAWNPSSASPTIWLRSNNTAIYSTLVHDCHTIVGANGVHVQFDAVTANKISIRNCRSLGGQRLFAHNGSFNLIEFQDCIVDSSVNSISFTAASTSTIVFHGYRAQNGTNAMQFTGGTYTIQGDGFSLPGMTAIATTGSPVLNMQTFNLPVNLTQTVYANGVNNYATHAGSTNNGPCTNSGSAWKNINTGGAPT
jgi:hypothetical protein